MTNSGASFGGVDAFIEEYSPYVAPGSGNLATQWVMLTNTNNGSQYAQIGWIERPGSKRNTVTQFSWGPGASDYWTNNYPPYAINTALEYKVLFDPNCTNGNCFTFWAGGHQWDHSSHDWTPNDWRTFSESHNSATQFPGGYNNPTTTAGIQRYYPAGSGGSWANVSGELSGNTQSPTGALTALPRWAKIDKPSANSYESWDADCAN